jgi:hypothetical protein
MPLQRQNFTWTLAATTLLTLAACGGGGGGGGDSTPAVTSTTFSGTAATGKALANAAVTITCAAGTGSTTTTATGTYSTAIASVTLPCALKAAGTDGTVLYSVTTATPTGPNTQTANITPLTQLMVASLAGAEPASFFANFNATTAAAVTPTSVAAAQTSVLGLLTQAGVSTTGVTDLIVGALTAGSGSGYDGVLDALQTQLAGSGTTLATLTTTVATTAPTAVASGATSTDHTPRLPASLLLKTAASNCPALRSGEYVSINPQRGVAMADQVGLANFNAATLTFTDPTNSGGGGTLVANGNCSYSIGTESYAVSKAGVMIGTNTENGKKGLNILLPRQAISVAELAGSWNGIGLDAGGDVPLESFGFNLSSTGAMSNLVVCDGAPTSASACVTENATINITSDSAGNLSISETTPGSTWTDRLFAYRTGSGDLMVIELSPDGGISAWTKKRALALPTVGQAVAPSRSFRLNSDMVITTVDDSPAGSIFAVDAATNSITRNQNQANGVSYKDTVIINQPSEGYQLRLPATVPGSDGSTVTIRARTNLSMTGTGLVFQLYPQINAFQAIVER